MFLIFRIILVSLITISLLFIIAQLSNTFSSSSQLTQVLQPKAIMVSIVHFTPSPALSPEPASPPKIIKTPVAKPKVVKSKTTKKNTRSLIKKSQTKKKINTKKSSLKKKVKKRVKPQAKKTLPITAKTVKKNSNVIETGTTNKSNITEANATNTINHYVGKKISSDTNGQKSAKKNASPTKTVTTAAIYNARYLNNVQPAYPRISKRLGEEGTVKLRVKVSRNGGAVVVTLKTSSGSQRLDQAAIQAVKNWTFIPAKRNGQAEASWVIIPIKFTLR